MQVHLGAGVQRRLQVRLLAGLQRRDRAVAREELIGLLWRTTGAAPETRAVDMLVMRLRAKLSDGDMLVATVRGCGYRLGTDVSCDG